MVARRHKKTEAELNRTAIAQVGLALRRLHGSWWQLATRSFVGGLLAALGATVGLAALLTLIGYILKWFGVVPGLSDISKAINEFITVSTWLR